MPPATAHRVKLVLAFATIYLIWGSTYLVIKWAVLILPPFLMAGVRFLLAGSVLYAYCRTRGAPRPGRQGWVAAGVTGGFLLLGGNGGVVWAASRIPSGVTSLLIATTPLWIVLFDWLRPRGVRPNLQVLLGIGLGMAGLALLVTQRGGGAAAALDPAGVCVVFASTLSWALGTILSRGMSLPGSSLLAAAMQQLAGGVLLCAAGLATGEARLVSAARLAAFTPETLRAWASFAYLVLIGSFVAYTAYVWLLRASTPARVSTYAFVNPVVAVFLGWALAGEQLTSAMVAAASIIVAGVMLITLSGMRRASK
jgi:drug/metabolite transporter (DMT)-like permease